MKKCAIIYLPNGDTQQFSTVNLNDTNWTVVTDIYFDSETPSITIVEIDIDKTKSFHTYCGIPFSVESWG